MTTEIVKLNPAEYGIEESRAQQIAGQFQPMLDRMTELEAEYNEIIKLDPEQPSTAKLAHDLRQKYVKVRTGTAAVHKEQKAFYLAAGRYIDGWKNAQIFASQGIEENLEKIEKHAEIREKARIDALQAERVAALTPYDVANASVLSLGTMSEQVWKTFFDGAVSAYNAKKDAEKRAEEERLAAQAAKALHEARKSEILTLWAYMPEDKRDTDFSELSDELWAQTKIWLQKQKDKADAEQARLRFEKEQADAEIKRQQDELRAQKEAADKEAARLKAEADARLKAQQEQSRKEREAAEKKAAEERAERQRLEAELAAKKAKEDAEAKAKIEAEKKAASAPDKEKLVALVQAIQMIAVPIVKTNEAEKIVDGYRAMVAKMVGWLDTEINKI